MLINDQLSTYCVPYYMLDTVIHISSLQQPYKIGRVIIPII